MTSISTMGRKQLNAILDRLDSPDIRGLIDSYTKEDLNDVISSICAGKLLLHISPWLDHIYTMYSSGDTPCILSFVSAYTDYIKARLDTFNSGVYISSVAAGTKAKATIAHVLLCKKEELPLLVNCDDIVMKPIAIWRLSKNI